MMRHRGRVVPTRYPAGGAKQLIRVLTGIEVPHGERSTDYGVQCFNVGTAYAIHEAIALGQPLISRIVTVAGNVGQAAQLRGAVRHADARPDRLVQARCRHRPGHHGRPDDGFPHAGDDVPVVKATNCMLVGSRPCSRRRRPKCPASAAANAPRPARPTCSLSKCTGSRARKTSARRRNTTCSTASSAAAAPTSAPRTFRWSITTASPRAKSGRAKSKRKPPTGARALRVPPAARGTREAGEGRQACRQDRRRPREGRRRTGRGGKAGAHSRGGRQEGPDRRRAGTRQGAEGAGAPGKHRAT
jgi:hypothetical protein